MRLRVATCQFPVSGNPRANAAHVKRLMHQAKQRGARVAHFAECSLAGYAAADLPSYRGYDWPALRAACEEVFEYAGKLGIWLVVGSAHPLSRGRKPHNSVYVVNDGGRLIDRYDKRFCAGDRKEKTVDLAHYTPGDHYAVFDIDGVRCGVMICYDFRFPELFRAYKKRGVDLLFHSFHAGNIPKRRLRELQRDVGKANHRFNAGTTLPAITMPATLQAMAGNSYLWISAANTSARESLWPSLFVRPDGVVTGRLRRNVSGVLISEVDTKADWYDSTEAWRDRAIGGRLHSGTLVRDPRSKRRRSL